MSQETIPILNDLIRPAIDEFYKNDMDEMLREDNIEKAVNERSMVFRIGIYIENIIKSSEEFKEYNLDAEYNRNQTRAKYIKKKKTYPDLILHKRGNNNNNLLVVEFKKGKPEQKDYKLDIWKLKHFTKSDGGYEFKYGFYIELYKNKYKIEIYKEGKLFKNIEKETKNL